MIKLNICDIVLFVFTIYYLFFKTMEVSAVPKVDENDSLLDIYYYILTYNTITY